jgi:hypothetical protein
MYLGSARIEIVGEFKLRRIAATRTDDQCNAGPFLGLASPRISDGKAASLTFLRGTFETCLRGTVGTVFV